MSDAPAPAPTDGPGVPARIGTLDRRLVRLAGTAGARRALVARVAGLLGTRPTTAVVAAWAAGDTERAAALVRASGTDPATPATTRGALALLAQRFGLDEAADDVIAASPDIASPAFEVTRARHALRDGRYTDALAHAGRSTHPERGTAASLAGQAAGRLVALGPGWVPDLGEEAHRLEAARGAPVRGRVLHLVAAALPYRQAGYTVRTQSVVLAQRDAGLTPHVATRIGVPGPGVADAPRELELDGVPYHFPDPSSRGAGRVDETLTRTARALVPIVDAVRPAVLQPASNQEQAQVALALGRAMGVPVAYEVRGFWEETWVAESGLDERVALASERYRLTREAETAAMRASDAVITLSETMAAEVRARGVEADRVVVVPNGVVADAFQPGPRDPVLAASAGIGPDELVVGYVTSVTAYEGLEVLLEAVARLRRSRRVRALIVGDGPHLEAVRDAAGRLGLDDGTLVLPGRVPHAEVAAWYRLIDVFVVPRIDTRVTRLVTPLKPYEAMALEIPVVMSDLPALREMVVPGETGELVAPGDAAALETVLGGLLDDEATRRRLGRNAREWVIANRSWRANGERYRALFERLGAA